MSGKIKKIYSTVIEGAKAGLTDDDLSQLVFEFCPKATSKKIVKASKLALSDPKMKDKYVLGTIFGLAIKHRCDPLSKDDIKAMRANINPKLKSEASEQPSIELEPTLQPNSSESPQMASS